LKKETLQHQFQNNENAIISLVTTITNDEITFINRLAKAIVGLRIDDWNTNSLTQFSNGLQHFKATVDKYNSDNQISNSATHSGTRKLTFIDDKGNEITRIFEKTERSNKANLLYNDITGAIEDMGQSISEQEKREVLIEILENMCK